MFAVNKNLRIYNGDILSAYIRARVLDDMYLYVEQLLRFTEINKDHMWKLKQSLYKLQF
jgi:hypothetical protein